MLLLQAQGLVKSVKFARPRYIGDPINAVKIFNDLKADELTFLDILASKEKRRVSLDFVSQVGAEANMPFAVGGGIRSLEEIRDILKAGAEKVILNSYAAESPDFVYQASETFGASSITVCLDVKKRFLSGLRTWTHGGTRATGYSPIDFARLMEQKGAGEIIVQSMDRDGTQKGYDIELLRQISQAVTIPVVALGGAGSLQHLREGHHLGGASGLAAGSLFVFQGPKNGVLINYPERADIDRLWRQH